MEVNHNIDWHLLNSIDNYMQFQTWQYILLFLPIILVSYHLLRKNIGFSNSALIIASFIFYGMSGWYFVFFLIFSSILDFMVGRRIHTSDMEVKRKRWLLVSITCNLSVLFFVKYSGLFSDDVRNLFQALGLDLGVLDYTIPLVAGISFYTFQTMSYTIDIYRRKEQPHPNLISYITFVSFFPQLIAGPIERSVNLLPQFEKVRSVVSGPVAASAVFLISWGLFKKLVFADNFGDIVDGADLRTPGMGLIFAYAFAFQIYCDFSAYTDIARGSARLFNINLMQNFRTPYFSCNPKEFWDRWHISLSTWIRDYVYIPLGGNRGSSLFKIRNLMLTMSLCGLWHGAGLNFVFWGLYHGVLLALYHRWPIDEKIIHYFGEAWGKFVSILILFNLVAVGWIFFRGSTLEIFLAFKSIGQLLGGQLTMDFIHATYILLIFAIPLFITEIISWIKDTEYPYLYEQMSLWIKTLHYVVLFYAILWLGKRLSNEFIYFQF